MEVNSFKEDCLKISTEIIVQKHLIDGTSYFFDCIRPGEEFQFKKDLAISLGVHIRDIVIVGSGKLGFSIKPFYIKGEKKFEYYYKAFDFDFKSDVENEKSDLDIAIVSSSLFDRQLVNVFEHTNSYSNYKFKNSKQTEFADYILKGWLRPDKTPKDYSITSEIKNVQEKYKIKYGRKINIGIYKSWFFFEKYHQNNVERIKLNLIANKDL